MGFATFFILTILIAGGLSKRHHDDTAVCDEDSYRKQALKLVKERAFAGLFRDVKNETKWEASGVAAVRGQFWVVFDSSYALGLLDDEFQFRGPNNKLVGSPGEEDSQFEGIAYIPQDDTFLLLHEALPISLRTASKTNEDNLYKPVISKVKVNADVTDYEVLQKCEVNFELVHENKGFESIIYVRTVEGQEYLLGLCEGNYCVGKSKGREPGNGRIVVSQLQQDENGCVWEPVKTINIPESAYFQDYAAMAYNHAIGKLAIVSQEDSAVWISPFNIDTLEFPEEDKSTIFPLPRDNDCRVVYCNAEGVQWLDNYRLLIASDKAKSYQPFWCQEKDQSIHIFALPPSWNPYYSSNRSSNREVNGDDDNESYGTVLKKELEVMPRAEAEEVEEAEEAEAAFARATLLVKGGGGRESGDASLHIAQG